MPKPRYYLHSYTNTDGETVYADDVWWKEMDGLFGRIKIMMPKGFTPTSAMVGGNCMCHGMSAVEAIADLTNPSREEI